MEIKISKTAHACTACAVKFEHDQYVYSHVFVVEETLDREDHCVQCKDAAARKQAYSAWTTQYYDPKVAEAEPTEQFSPLRQLFYESVEAESRNEQAMAFLAAQLLRRQKVFRLIKQSDEADGEVKLLLYSDRIGNRLIEVRDPSFSFNELDMARIQMLDRLRTLEAAADDDAEATLAQQPSEAEPAQTASSDKAPEEGGLDAPDTNDGDDEAFDNDDDFDDDEEEAYDVDENDVASNQVTEEVEEDHVKTI